MHSLLVSTAAWIVSTIAAMGYGGVCLLMAIESCGVPLPSEVIMPFAGYLVSLGKLGLVGVATAGAIGCNLGSIPAYAIGYYGGRPLILKFGRWVLIGADELDKAEAFFARFGPVAVLIGRLLPVIRSVIAFPAGAARMRQLPFHVFTFIGSWPWCFALAYVGERLGAAWASDPRLHAIMAKFTDLVVLAIVAAAIFYIWHRMRGIGKRA